MATAPTGRAAVEPRPRLPALLVVPQRRRPRVRARCGVGGVRGATGSRGRGSRRRRGGPSMRRRRATGDRASTGGGPDARDRGGRSWRRSGGASRYVVGGDKRSRYRTWLDIAGGRFDLVVGTRPAVFAPVRNVGADRGVPRESSGRIARIGRRTTTCVMSRWSGLGSAGPCACSPRSAPRRRPRARHHGRSLRRPGGGRR